MSTIKSPPSITRRQLLAASTAGVAGASGGCIQRVRSIFNRDTPSPASLTILTLPTDNDGLATQIANTFASNLQEVGIDAQVEYLPYVELYREVLINRDFDMFVGRLPQMGDPDALRPLLHSVFTEETGWQNPYGFTNINVDGLLDDQRFASGPDRMAVVEDLLGQVALQQPFTTIGFYDSLRAVREEKFTGWNRYNPRSPLTYLALDRTDNVDSDSNLKLRVSVDDARLTRNFNPLTVEYRAVDTFLGLVYDPLVYRDDGNTIPWLAENVEWRRESGETIATVSLRPDLFWHDETPLSASDIAFTYRFLEDTSLGELAMPAPAPRYRGQSSLVEDVEAVDYGTVEFSFGRTTQEVAERALTAPVLPEHRWSDETNGADVSGIESSETVTEALVFQNSDPIGSGPLVVDDMSSGESVTMSQFEDHFLYGETPPDLPDDIDGGPAFDTLELQTSPSAASAISVLSAGNIDATAATLPPEIVSRVEGNSGLSLHTDESAEAYHIGYNTAEKPFSNPYFRRLVARLLDKSQVVEDIFLGRGEPAATPFQGTDWNPSDLVFEEADPEVPFLGSDGEVDVEAAREAFRERGFVFNSNDKIVLR